MSKQEIIKSITEKFAAMGIAYKTGVDTDITISAELLDAGWSTGKKKINYKSLIFADQNSQTIFMWMLTKEVGAGFSFGGDSERSFQSGATLFRKVKSVQYGPEGKVFEYEFDLGAIPKAVKEAAKQFGWKFKTVINRQKALWPADYAQTQSRKEQTTNNEVPAQNASDGILFCSHCGNKLSAAAVFCPECGIQLRETVQPHTPGRSQEQAPEQPIKADKTSALFWIMFSLFALFDLMFGRLFGSVFAVLALIALIVLYKNRKRISKGIFKTLLWFISVFIILAVVYVLTIFTLIALK